MINLAITVLRFVWLSLIWAILLVLTTGILWELGLIGAFLYVT